MALDVESSGLDLHHSARPFFVTLCDERLQQTFYEWQVDPFSRMPIIPDGDVEEIRSKLQVIANWGRWKDEEVRERHVLVGHNAKFDCLALETIGITNWPWGMTRDTILAGHLLESNGALNLTDMAWRYLRQNIEKLELDLGDAVQACRRYCRSHFKAKTTVDLETGVTTESQGWRIAKEGYPDMPSAKGKDVWRSDYWLPRTLANNLGLPEPEDGCEHDWSKEKGDWTCLSCGGHRWHTVLRDYANADSLITMSLWLNLRPMIHERKLWAIYLERMKTIPVAVEMERGGVTVSKTRLDELVDKYTTETNEAESRCVSVANNYGYELKLPAGAGRNDNLVEFVFNTLKVPVVYTTDTGKPSLDKEAKAHYLATLPQGPALDFFKAYQFRAKRMTALGYMESYKRFWHETDDPDTFLLHSVLNPTKARTLRWSSERPNSQNISKQEIECDRCDGDGCKACNFSGVSFRSTRYCFGPEPVYEWYSMDFQNLELRLPAYLCGEKEMIELFERPNDPPYYGSNHLLNFSAMYPELWLKHLDKQIKNEKHIKKEFGDTWYQWCKNTGFALLYGCGKAKADATAHKEGAYDLINMRFREMHRLSQDCIRFANKHGYVETIPDRTVDPLRGYPVMCTLTDRGEVLSTVPLSYKIQSSAMWDTGKGMIRCQAVIDRWRREENFKASIKIQVHDEMVFALPKQPVSPVDELPMEKKYGAKWRGKSNLWRVRILQREMEKGGITDFNIPTPVGVEFHPVSWSEGIAL